MRNKGSVFFLTLSYLIFGDASIGYVTSQGPSTVTRVDLATGNAPSIVATIPGQNLAGLALANPSTAYVTSLSNNNIYRIDLSTGNYAQVNQSSVPGAGLDRIALANETTAYIGGFNDGNLYRLNITDGSITQVTPNPIPGGIVGIALDLTVGNPTIAYAGHMTDGNIYKIDLSNGSYSVVATIPGAGARTYGLCLANNTTAYVTDHANNNVFRIDLTNGNVSFINTIPIPGSGSQTIALANPITAFTGGNSSSAVFQIDLTTNNLFQVALFSAGFIEIGLVLQIGTAGLSGNNLKFAKYLNENAFLTVPLIALQDDIPGALEIAAPTRNAILTFAAQTTQIAFGTQLYQHLGQKRWGKAWHQNQAVEPQPEMTAFSAWHRNRLLADNANQTETELVPEKTDVSEETENPVCSPVEEQEVLPLPVQQEFASSSCKKHNLYSPWLSAFGEYTRESEQDQTPGFETGSGGFVAALDYCKDVDSLPLVGTGIAYAHTHVHEKEGQGHANIDQGALVFYGAYSVKEWYFDLALWGGFYHAENERKIFLPGIVGGVAHASANGWQLTPHFEIGYDYDKNWFCVEPFLMLDWVANWEESFREHGAGRLNVHQKSRFCSLLRNETGVRFNETLTYAWGTLTFREKASYAYQKTFHTGRITAFLVGAPGSFVVSTFTGAENLGIVEFESLFVPANKKYPYGTISYQGEFGSRYQSHQGTVTIGMDF